MRDIETLAAACGTSTRTLYRRLAEHGVKLEQFKTDGKFTPEAVEAIQRICGVNTDTNGAPEMALRVAQAEAKCTELADVTDRQRAEIERLKAEAARLEGRIAVLEAEAVLLRQQADDARAAAEQWRAAADRAQQLQLAQMQLLPPARRTITERIADILRGRHKGNE